MDSMWNRTVNLAGGPGRNLECDIVNEFLNKEFKGRYHEYELLYNYYLLKTTTVYISDYYLVHYSQLKTELLKDAGGNLTEETIYRHSQLAGSLGRLIDRAYAESVETRLPESIRKSKPNFTQDLQLFVK
jgi:hypothetical protein